MVKEKTGRVVMPATAAVVKLDGGGPPPVSESLRAKLIFQRSFRIN
jgi:hypothetical protein